MRFAGVLGEDEPNPLLQAREQALSMPMPTFGLVPQPHLEDWGAIGVGSATFNGDLDSCHVSIGYTLWRNPGRRDDPANLAELDEEQRRALEYEPPWPRPPWLVEQVQRMRYPMLGDCVRTRWSRLPGRYDSADAVLLDHMNEILVNQFRPDVSHDVEAGAPILVDGTARPSLRVDTDPHVYGVAIDFDAHVVLSAVIPRHALPYVEIAFAERAVS